MASRSPKSEDVAGAWRTYEFNITDAALPGKTNVLAVQVFSPTDTDLAITFVDWNPAPPDKNMGLFRERGHLHQRSGGAALSRRGFESGFARQ